MVIDTSMNYFDIERFPDGRFAFRPKDYELGLKQREALMLAEQKIAKNAILASRGVNVATSDFVMEQSKSIKTFIEIEGSQKTRVTKKAEKEEEEEKVEEPAEPKFAISGEFEKIEVKVKHMDESVKEDDNSPAETKAVETSKENEKEKVPA